MSLFEASSTGKEVGVGGSADGFLPADDDGDSVDGDVNLQIRPGESKLPPISGTALAKNAEYMKKSESMNVGSACIQVSASDSDIP